jgi:hypothetical protein
MVFCWSLIICLRRLFSSESSFCDIITVLCCRCQWWQLPACC